MVRKASQTAVNPISRSGMDQPASMPSSQLRNGLRQRAGKISERAAIAENAKSIGKAETDLLCHGRILHHLPNKANPLPQNGCRTVRHLRGPTKSITVARLRNDSR